MYADDHNPPHFHARHGEFRALVEIATGNMMQGTMPRRALRLIQAWVEIHEKELLHNWKEGQKESPDFSKIEPLR